MLWQSVLLAGKVDVIHGNWTAPAIIGALAGKMRKTPAIARLRGEDLSRAKNSFLFRLMLKYCLKLNRRIVCVSEAMHHELASSYPEFAEKIRFIANGVVRVEHSQRTSLREPIHLVTVGSMIERKQIDVIISAIAEPNLRGRVRLRIVGGGPLLDQLNSLAENLSVTSAIEFLGPIDPEDVWTHLSWADFFVFASKSEGRPNAILEAMAARLPVVSSDIDGVRELLLPDCGFLYPQGDHLALSKQLAYLASENDKVEACVASAFQRLAELNLTWDNAATQYLRLYKELLE